MTGLKQNYAVNTNGELTPEYAATGRFQLNGNNLMIKVVQREDAGKYICIEDMGKGDRAFIEISVLESAPHCSTNINKKGMVAGNDFGIQPEDIFLNCSLTYYGNIAPELEWKASDESYIIDKINISNISENNGKKIMIQAVTQAILKQDGSQYVCQTKHSKEKYPCYSAMVRTLYFFNSPVKNSSFKEPRLIKCSANTSQTCNYTWTANEENIVVPTGEYLDLSALQSKKSGIVEYTCRAECELRNRIFTVMPMIVKFEPLNNQLLPQDCGCSLSALYGVITILVLIIVAVISYKFYHRIVKRCGLSTKKRYLDDENETYKPLLRAENEDQEDNRVLLKDYYVETAIQGLAIIKKKLFVSVKNSNTILVFEAQEPYHKLNDEIHVKGLENPVDMTSAKDSDSQKHCLYITDSEYSRQYVWKIEFVNLSGKIETKAPTCYTVGSGWPHTVSAADDGRLLITKEGRPPKFSIHGMNYGKIESIDLPSEVKWPRHALSNGKNFIISHSDGICKIDSSGKVLQRFSLPPHNLLVNLNEDLTHMTTDGHRVFVADYSNHRVVCFDPESSENIVVFHTFGEYEWPTRVLYNKLNNHLLIGMESGKIHVRPTKNGMESGKVHVRPTNPTVFETL